jgi:hypothetical protein
MPEPTPARIPIPPTPVRLLVLELTDDQLAAAEAAIAEGMATLEGAPTERADLLKLLAADLREVQAERKRRARPGRAGV